jgi:hypothetical protein
MMGPVIPDFVTHYFMGGRPPFLNLSDLTKDGRAPIIAGLAQERADGSTSRLFGRRYMDLRQQTEEKLRALFIASGGVPQRRAPHYFVLGASSWYRGLAPDMNEVVLKLEDLPTETTSFTYPDSFVSMGLGVGFGLHHSPQPYHGTVFHLSRLGEIVARYGLPEDAAGGYEGYERQPFEKFIEVQLWSDEPVAAYLTHATKDA